MKTEHPITPPPELVQQWCSQLFGCDEKPEIAAYELARWAARWGADMELEACCEWLVVGHWFAADGECINDLRAARRPKPPSLKERIATAIAHGDNSIALALLDQALPD